MLVVFHFILGLIMAFIASIPVGPVNLAVVQVSLRLGKIAGMWIALGSALAELGYATLAVWGVNLFLTNPKIMLTIQFISIPVLMLLGIRNILSPPPEASHQKNTSSKGTFILGFTLTILNPLLLPFWLFMCAWIRSFSIGHTAMLGSTQDSTSFALGVATGSFLLLTLVSILSAGKEMSPQTKKIVYQVLGWLFVGIAIFQCYQVWLHS